LFIRLKSAAQITSKMKNDNERKYESTETTTPTRKENNKQQQ
jgi:hypothetical protein